MAFNECVFAFAFAFVLYLYLHLYLYLPKWVFLAGCTLVSNGLQGGRVGQYAFGKLQVHTNTETQIYKHKYRNTNIETQIHKHKYTNTDTQTQIHKQWLARREGGAIRLWQAQFLSSACILYFFIRILHFLIFTLKRANCKVIGYFQGSKLSFLILAHFSRIIPSLALWLGMEGFLLPACEVVAIFQHQRKFCAAAVEKILFNIARPP